MVEASETSKLPDVTVIDVGPPTTRVWLAAKRLDEVHRQAEQESGTARTVAARERALVAYVSAIVEMFDAGGFAVGGAAKGIADAVRLTDFD